MAYVDMLPRRSLSVSGHLTFLGKLTILIPICWALGVDFLFPFFIVVMVSREFVRLTFEETLILFLCFWLSLSLLVSGVTSGARVSAALYSICLLFSCVIISQSVRYRLVRVSHEVMFEAVRRAFGFLFACCTIFIFIGLFIGFVIGEMNFNFPTLLGMISPVTLPGIAERSMIAEIIRPDWGFGSFAMPRPLTFAPWYTAGAMTVFVSGIFYLMARVALGARFRAEVLIEALILVLLFFSLSRTIMGMYVVGFVFGAVIFRDQARMFILAILTVILLIILFSIGIGINLLEFRSYSTETRFSAYVLGLDYAADRSVFFGIGYKPHSSEVSVPIGSHSSFISFFVRGGGPALLLFFFAFYLFPLVRWLPVVLRQSNLTVTQRKVAQFGFRFQIMLWGWLPFQEIDTAAIATTLIFVCLAINYSLQRGFLSNRAMSLTRRSALR